MDEMWKALQWVYDNNKIPTKCRETWATMLKTKTAAAADAAAAAAAAIKLGYVSIKD